MPNDPYKPLPPEYRREDFFRIDEPALRCAFPSSEFVVFRAEGGVGEGLVCDGDGFESVRGEWVGRVFVRVVFDCQASYKIYTYRLCDMMIWRTYDKLF